MALRFRYSPRYRITGHCLIFFPTFRRCKANTISGERSKKPSPRFQLTPHLQCCKPMNCCFIFLPQFGQILLLPPFFLGADEEAADDCGLSGSPPSRMRISYCGSLERSSRCIIRDRCRRRTLRHFPMFPIILTNTSEHPIRNFGLMLLPKIRVGSVRLHLPLIGQ